MTPPSRKRQPNAPKTSRQKKPYFDALIEDSLSDPAFRQAWQALEPKRRIVTALLRLRAEANLTQKELAARAGWSPAFVSRLESFPGSGEKLYMPDLATLETYAAACGSEVGLVFGRAKGRGARFEVTATAGFGDDKRFRRALAAISGCAISAPRGGPPHIVPREKCAGAAGGRARRR